MTPGVGENAAWAKADIALSVPDALAFIEDIEGLFRLNPHLEISDWREEPGARRSCRARLANEVNGRRDELQMAIEPLPDGHGLRLVYARGLKASTELLVEASGEGSSLTIVDRYHPVTNADDERLVEVDRSLVPWLAAIRGHLSGLARYGWLPGYRWWAGRFMPGMPPRQRRIVRMILWVSLFEFVAFLFVVGIFWLARGN